MKIFNKTLVVISFLMSLISAKLSAQDYSNILAVITETAEYQTSKKAGEKLYASLHNNVTVANGCHNISSLVRKYKDSNISEMDAVYIQSWTKLELNNDGSLWLELPFSFSFFDLLHNSIWINANGNVSFDHSVGHFQPEKFPINTKMIAPFWADLEANVQNQEAGIFILIDKNKLHILYYKMSLYNQDPSHTITFEVIVKGDNNSLNSNLAYIYHQVDPKLMETLNNLETKNNPAYLIGVNAGDDINHLQEEKFESMTFLFDLALARP